MAFRTILKYPDRRLLKKSQRVNEGEDISTLVNDLVDTLNRIAIVQSWEGDDYIGGYQGQEGS